MTRTELARIWLAHVEEQQCSGMSQRAYCAAHDLSLRGFVYWRRKRKRQFIPTCPFAAEFCARTFHGSNRSMASSVMSPIFGNSWSSRIR